MRTFQVTYLSAKDKPSLITVEATNKYRVAKMVYKSVGFKCWIVSTVEVAAK